MPAGKRVTEKEYRKRLKESNIRHGNRDIELVDPYTRMVEPTLHRCRKCGYTWKVKPNNLLNGQNCPGCHKVSVKPISYFKDKLTKLYKDKADVIYVKRSSNNAIELKVCCHTCKYIWSPSYLNALKASGCPNCSGRLQTTESVIQRLKDKFGDSVNYSKVTYKGATTPITLVCPKHGKFRNKPNHLYYKVHACPKCSEEAVANSHKWDTTDFVQAAREIHGAKYDYKLSNYTGSHNYITIICPKHGEWTTLPYNHIHSKTGCPKCATSIRTTKPHQTLLDVLDSKGVEYISNERTLLSGKEIDIYLPVNKVGIEINGVYWHSEKFLDNNYHYNKAKECKKLGIRLLQFWDFEVLQKQKIILSIIRNILGRSKRVYARKLKIQYLDSKIASNWFECNHIQGKPYGKYETIALVDDTNKILCAAAFGKPRFNCNFDWELLRFCNKLGTSVVGGASKVFHNFVVEYNPKSIISYADLRYSQGDLYRILGFRLQNTSKPNFFYHKNGSNIISRYKAQKHRLSNLLEKYNPQLSGNINMLNHGYVRVYDAGNLVFIWG